MAGTIEKKVMAGNLVATLRDWVKGLVAGKYTKPSGGIPKSDLSSGVQTSLNKANSALQEHQSLAAYRTAAAQDDIDNAIDARATAIEGKIPSQASSVNQLADKAFVNSSINALAAYYITSNAAGDAFATKAALIAGPYYNGGQLRTPTKNDYAIVLADESRENATTRYSYDGTVWAYQYKVNDTPLTAAQLAAINSGITSALVGKLSALPTATEISTTFGGKVDKVTGKGLSTNDYTTAEKNKLAGLSNYDDTAVKARLTTIEGKEAGWDAKQSALVSGTNIKTINNQSILGSGNIEIQGGSEGSVRYDGAQTLTDAQKTQARANIDAASKVPVVSQSSSVAIEPNKVTKLGTLTGSVSLTLAIGETGKANIYDIIFSTGASVPTISWPTGISWASGIAPTINASKNYEVSISESLAIITEY